VLQLIDQAANRVRHPPLVKLPQIALSGNIPLKYKVLGCVAVMAIIALIIVLYGSGHVNEPGKGGGVDFDVYKQPGSQISDATLNSNRSGAIWGWSFLAENTVSYSITSDAPIDIKFNAVGYNPSRAYVDCEYNGTTDCTFTRSISQKGFYALEMRLEGSSNAYTTANVSVKLNISRNKDVGSCQAYMGGTLANNQSDATYISGEKGKVYHIQATANGPFDLYLINHDDWVKDYRSSLMYCPDSYRVFKTTGILNRIDFDYTDLDDGNYFIFIENSNNWGEAYANRDINYDLYVT
jgi:hypothetical protein